MAARPELVKPSNNRLSYEIQIVGKLNGADDHDVYHQLASLPGWAVLALMIVLYFVLNALFAVGYLATGGLGGAQPGSFLDAFFFSVETMATIGYGVIYPASRAANVLMVGESIAGIVYTALATGLLFVRFSRIRGRVVFSKKIVISPLDGVPTLSVRIANGRRNAIYDADFRLMLTRTQVTKEGSSIYRTEDLKLLRAHAPTLGRSWMIIHRIDETSPLFNETPESMQAAETEVLAAVSGMDATVLQPVHGRYTWEFFDIEWGAKFADVLTEQGQVMTMNLDKFHIIEPSVPTEKFPYPKR